MSLDGAKLICLDEEGNQGEIILAKGRKFTIGYYMSCDHIIDEDDNAKGVHCEINSDAFGRVTIHNLSEDHPINLNGNVVQVKRPLLNGNKIKILGKNYVWSFPKVSSPDVEIADKESTSTPGNKGLKAEQPPNSCPSLKLHRDIQRRLTVHSFSYSIRADECATITEKCNTNRGSLGSSQISETDCVPVKRNISSLEPTMEEVGNEERSMTPEPGGRSLLIDLGDTPKINLINCTINKENVCDTGKVKNLLSCCRSDIVVTSFSPRQTGVCVEKSFATVLKPNTSHSVYSTPMTSSHGKTNDQSLNFIDFSTSATTSKKLNSSMHLIDLTTPGRTKLSVTTDSPLDRAHSFSSLKNRTPAINIKINESGISPMDTPDVKTVRSSGSVISVNSTDVSSVVEVSDSLSPSCSGAAASPASGTSAATTCNITPRKMFSNKALTPKRTPQSLIKRALLTSAKKRGITPEGHIANAARSTTNITPSHSNSCMASAPSPERMQFVTQRGSMTTPIRRAGVNRFDASSNTPRSSLLLKYSKPRSPPISKSIGKLSTSTPFRRSSLAQRMAVKTSPDIYKVRKLIGTTPISHVSKIRNPLALMRSSADPTPATLTSANIQSKSMYIPTPANARARAIAASIIKNPQLSQKAEETKAQAFVHEKRDETISETNNDLNRTFTLDSSDQIVPEIPKNTDKNVTFSPEKEEAEVEKSGSKKLNVTFSPEKSVVSISEHENREDKDLKEKNNVCDDYKDVDKESVSLSINQQGNPEEKTSSDCHHGIKENLSVVDKDAGASIDEQNNSTKDLSNKDHDQEILKDISIAEKEMLITSPEVSVSDGKSSIESTISQLSPTTKAVESDVINKTAEESLIKDEQDNADLLEQIEDVLNKSDELKKHLEAPSDSADQRINANESDETIEKLSEGLDGKEEEEEEANKLTNDMSNQTETKELNALKFKSCSPNVTHDENTVHVENRSDPEQDNPCNFENQETKDPDNVEIKSQIIFEPISENSMECHASLVVAEDQMSRDTSELKVPDEGLPNDETLDILSKTDRDDKNASPELVKQVITQSETLDPASNAPEPPERSQNIPCRSKEDPKVNKKLESSHDVSVDALVETPVSFTPRRSVRRASMIIGSTSQVLEVVSRTPRRAKTPECTKTTAPKRIMRRATSTSPKSTLTVARKESKRQEESLIDSIFEEEIADAENGATTNTDHVTLQEAHSSVQFQKDNNLSGNLREDNQKESKEVQVADVKILSGDSNISDVICTDSNIGKESPISAPNSDIIVVLEEDKICEVVHDSADAPLKDDQHSEAAVQGQGSACKILDVSDYEYGKEIKSPSSDGQNKSKKYQETSQNPTTMAECTESNALEEGGLQKKLSINDSQLTEISVIKVEKELQSKTLGTKSSTSTDIRNVDFKCPPVSSTPNTLKKDKILPSFDDNNEESNSSIQTRSSKGRVSKFLIERGLLPKPENFNSQVVNASEIEDEGLDKFFSTPRAKDVMILTSPKSVNLKENNDSVGSEEYEMSTTNLDNLDDMFKSPVSTRYRRYTSNSLAGEKEGEDVQKASPEEAFDKLVGRNSAARTSDRKVYSHKILSNSQSVLKSPFSATDIISDLPKTDIQEWVDSLEDVEIPKDMHPQEESIFADEVDVSDSNCNISRDPLSLSTMESMISFRRENPDSASPNIFDTSGVSSEASVPKCEDGENNANSNHRAVSGEKEFAKVTSPKEDADMSGIDLLDPSEDSLISEPLESEETESVVNKTLVEKIVLDTENEEAINFEEEFKNFNNHKSKKGVLSRSMTPKNSTRVVKPSRKSLGNRGDLQITIDFESEKLKVINERLSGEILNPIIGKQSEKLNVENMDKTEVQYETTLDSNGALKKPGHIDAVVVNDKDKDDLTIITDGNTPNVELSDFSKKLKVDSPKEEVKTLSDSTLSSAVVDKTEAKGRGAEDYKSMIKAASSSPKEIVPVHFIKETVIEKDPRGSSHVETVNKNPKIDSSPKEFKISSNLKESENLETNIVAEEDPSKISHVEIDNKNATNESPLAELALCTDSINDNEPNKRSNKIITSKTIVENVQSFVEKDEIIQQQTGNDDVKTLSIEGSEKLLPKQAGVIEPESTSELSKIPVSSHGNVFDAPLEEAATDPQETQEKVNQMTEEKEDKTSDVLVNCAVANQQLVINEGLDEFSEIEGNSVKRSDDKVGFVKSIMDENHDNLSEEVEEKCESDSSTKTSTIISSNKLLKNQISEDQLRIMPKVFNSRKDGAENVSLQTEFPQRINDRTNLAVNEIIGSAPEHDPSEQRTQKDDTNTENSEHQLLVDEHLDIVEEKEQEEGAIAKVNKKTYPKRTRGVKRKVTKGESEEVESIVKTKASRKGGEKKKVGETNIEISVITDPSIAPPGDISNASKTTLSKDLKETEELSLSPKNLAVESKETSSTVLPASPVEQNMPQDALLPAAIKSSTQDTPKPLTFERTFDPLVTSRGRTRKPTAKAQQFLEEERAKAATPKRRKLLASASKDSATSQKTPKSQKGKLPITKELLASSTPQQSDGVGRTLIAEIKNYSGLIEEQNVVVKQTNEKEENTPLKRLFGSPDTSKLLQISTVNNETDIPLATPQSVKRSARTRKLLNLENSELDSRLEQSTSDHVQKSYSVIGGMKSTTLDIISEDNKSVQQAIDAVGATQKNSSRTRRKAPAKKNKKNDSQQSERTQNHIINQSSESPADLEMDNGYPQKDSAVDGEKGFTNAVQKRAVRGGRRHQVSTETIPEQLHSRQESSSIKESLSNIEEKDEKPVKARGRARKISETNEISQDDEDHNELQIIEPTSQTDNKIAARRVRKATYEKGVIPVTQQKEVNKWIGKNHRNENELDKSAGADPASIKSVKEDNSQSVFMNSLKNEERGVRVSSRLRKGNDLVKSHVVSAEVTDDDNDDNIVIDEPHATKIIEAENKKSIVVSDGSGTTLRRTARKRGAVLAIEALAEQNHKISKGNAEAASDIPKSSRPRREAALSKKAHYIEDTESMSSMSTIREPTENGKKKPKSLGTTTNQEEESIGGNIKPVNVKPKTTRSRRGVVFTNELQHSKEVKDISSASMVQEFTDHNSAIVIVDYKEDHVDESTKAANDKSKKPRARRAAVAKKQPQYSAEIDNISSASTIQARGDHKKEEPKSENLTVEQNEEMAEESSKARSDKSKKARARRAAVGKNQHQYNEEIDNMVPAPINQKQVEDNHDEANSAKFIEEHKEESTNAGSVNSKKRRAQRATAGKRRPYFYEEIEEDMILVSPVQAFVDSYKKELKLDKNTVEHKEENVEESTKGGRDKSKKSRARRAPVGKRQLDHNEVVESVSSMSMGLEYENNERETKSAKTRREKAIVELLSEKKEEKPRSSRKRRGEELNKLIEGNQNNGKQKAAVSSAPAMEVNIALGDQITEEKIKISKTAARVKQVGKGRNKRNDVPAEELSTSPVQMSKSRGGVSTRKVTFMSPAIAVEPSAGSVGASKKPKRSKK